MRRKLSRHQERMDTGRSQEGVKSIEFSEGAGCGIRTQAAQTVDDLQTYKCNTDNYEKKRLLGCCFNVFDCHR